MKHLNLIPVLLGAAVIAMLAGCGSDNRESSQSGQVTASQACIACHNTTLSPVTGNSIVAEYLKSAHSTASGAPGCNDCHQVDGHPENGSIPPIPNDLVCVTCHTVRVPIKTAAAHFANLSASFLGLPESRLSQTLINPATGDPSSSSCNGCHNPHDVTSLLPVNRQWEASAHAATTDDPFKEDPFIKLSPCNRCHTATGYRFYMTIGKQTIIQKATPLAGQVPVVLGAYSSAKEVISCNACHTNYSFKRISTDPNVTNFVNYSAPYARFDAIGKFFPGNLNNPNVAGNFDIGDTKLCIPCHGGREGRTGASITAASTSPDPHYFAAAGVMYMKIAFINFTTLTAPIATTPTATTYGKTLISSDDLSGGVASTHRRLGTTAIRGDSHDPSFFVPGNLDSGGPCVVCHLTAGHTLAFDDPTFGPDTYNKVCIHCHPSERGTPLNANNFLSAFVDENRDQMNNALALAVKLLENNFDITVQLADIEEPQEASFVRKSTGQTMNAAGWATYVTAGQPGAALTQTQLLRLKGAIFNIALGFKENTAFLHARTYTRRFLYDTIDWLDDGIINMTVGATALGPVGQGIKDANGNPVFGKGATAFADSTLTALAPGTTPSMTYILGFSRTTGAWTTPERP